MKLLLLVLFHVYISRAQEVPVIDLAEKEDVIVKQIAKASIDWGFFQVVNHGIPDQLITNLRQEAMSFFKAEPSVKLAVKRTRSNSRGYYEDELTKNTLDWKQGFDFGQEPHPELPPDHPDNTVMDGYNQWPADRPAFKLVLQEYYAALAKLSARLMTAVAASLGQPSERFEREFTPHSSFLRLNYYPVCPAPTEHFAVNRHTDAGGLTVLLQQDNVTALQVNHGGVWRDIEPVAGAYTVNIGDMLQVWSNGLYKAPEHRVLASSTTERFSAPFFYNPSYESVVQPLATCITDDVEQVCKPPQYSPIQWGMFRRRRFEGDFADVGEEVQIEHFRLHNDDATTAATAT